MFFVFHCEQKTLRKSCALILKTLKHPKFCYSYDYLVTELRVVQSARSVITLVNKRIRLPPRGRPILFITRMITDRIGLHSLLLPITNRRVSSLPFAASSSNSDQSFPLSSSLPISSSKSTKKENVRYWIPSNGNIIRSIR